MSSDNKQNSVVTSRYCLYIALMILVASFLLIVYVNFETLRGNELYKISGFGLLILDSFTLLFVGIGLNTAWGYSHIVINSNGIIKRYLTKKIEVCWCEVSDITTTGAMIYVICTTKKITINKFYFKFDYQKVVYTLLKS